MNACDGLLALTRRPARELREAGRLFELEGATIE